MVVILQNSFLVEEVFWVYDESAFGDINVFNLSLELLFSFEILDQFFLDLLHFGFLSDRLRFRLRDFNCTVSLFLLQINVLFHGGPSVVELDDEDSRHAKTGNHK